MPRMGRFVPRSPAQETPGEIHDRRTAAIEQKPPRYSGWLAIVEWLRQLAILSGEPA